MFGETATIIQLTRAPDTSEGYRTNFGYVNVTDKFITIKAELVASNGTSLGTLSYNLQAYGYNQVSDIFGEVHSGWVYDGRIVVWTTTPGGRFFAYASVVDNLSNDPIFIPAQRDVLAR